MLEIDGICKSYHGNPVLEKVSFCLPAGCCIGITGENGVGKSTLLRVIAQMERPDRGDLRCDGISILGNREFLRRHVGYVPQDADLMEELTVQGLLKLWQSACGLHEPLPEDIMAFMGIEPMLNRRIRALSGGMKRRVSIAMALLNRPEILIMDEATAGLDKDHRQRLLTWLEGFLSRGGSVVWCSHDAEELDRLCGTFLRLGDQENNGRH